MSSRLRNRLLYAVALAVVLGLTWMYGGRMLYVSLYALLLLPVFSYVVTFVLLHGLQVAQGCTDSTIVKEELGCYHFSIRNRTPIMYNDIQCLFVDDHFAVETDAVVGALFARPFMHETHEVRFKVKYRGEYRLGLRALKVNDMLGLFTLNRKLKDTITLTVLPRVNEISYFPLATNLLSQAHSNYEIKDEDYSVVSDIRPYVPSDSMKRVHWKLTAKRSEWMVKTFQSNALNRISIILDTAKQPIPYEEWLPLEDRMIETVLAVTHYCLRRQMPVEFIVAGGVAQTGRMLGDYEAIYRMAAGIVFEDAPEGGHALPLLDKCLNESTSYINVVIAASRLDATLYDRIISANRAGHFIALLYFTLAAPDPESDTHFRMLSESGAACFKLSEDTIPYE